MALNLAASAFTSMSDSTNSTSSAIPTHLLESLVPGFGTARSIVWSYSGIDITYIVTWCVLLFALGSGARYVWEIVYDSVILQYCVATVSIQANERLNDEILSWMSAHVSRGSRFVAAQSARTGDDNIIDPYAYSSRNKRPRLTKEDYDERTPPVKYFPSLGTHWFWFRGRLFMFQRGQFTIFSRNTRSLYTEFARGGEPLVIMCFGRSLKPLQDFVQHCKAYAEEAKQMMTAVHVKGDKYRYPDSWGQTVMRPARSLETINMDEDSKRDIIKDVDAYMHPSARHFYGSRGIPFRRGYLFHGPPGTGKTSFSLALAGHCKLDLYMLSLANGSLEEDDLNRMFALLPPRCVVLLEDIDSAGIKRESSDDDDDEIPHYRSGRSISLSGLLNAIDGTSSQEGRILIMTSNQPEKLDPALVRPGRIDKKVFFGYINKPSAKQLFMRMFSSVGREDGADIGLALIDEKVEDLQSLANRFAQSIPEEKLTPAELQGFLLAHRSSPTSAVEEVAAWVEEELRLQEERRRAEEEKVRKKAEKKKLKKALKALEKEIDAESDGDDAREAPAGDEETNGREQSAAMKTGEPIEETKNESSAVGDAGSDPLDVENADAMVTAVDNSTRMMLNSAVSPDDSVNKSGAPRAEDEGSGNSSEYDELSASDLEDNKKQVNTVDSKDDTDANSEMDGEDKDAEP